MGMVSWGIWESQQKDLTVDCDLQSFKNHDFCMAKLIFILVCLMTNFGKLI